MEPPKTKIEIQKMVDEGIQESLHLDYKDSRALTKKKRDEIIKDITAFANADGGVIIYGVQEKGHVPLRIDDGVNNLEISREWIDQILTSNITPPIEGIEIIQIPLDVDHSIYVISVSKTYRGPHQSADKKYYKRYNFQSCPMDHYEIFDIAGRRSRARRLVNVDIEIDRTIFKLIVSNVGYLAAQDVLFQFPDDFKWPKGKEYPQALLNGIKYFPPERKLSFYYASAQAIFNDKKEIPSELTIIVSYLHPELGEKIAEEFYLNFNEFQGVAVERNIGEELISAIKGLSHILVNMTRGRSSYTR